MDTKGYFLCKFLLTSYEVSSSMSSSFTIRRNTASEASDLCVRTYQRIEPTRTLYRLLGLGFGLGLELWLRSDAYKNGNGSSFVAHDPCDPTHSWPMPHMTHDPWPMAKLHGHYIRAWMKYVVCLHLYIPWKFGERGSTPRGARGPSLSVFLSVTLRCLAQKA